jgi:hypothetical protein
LIDSASKPEDMMQKNRSHCLESIRVFAIQEIEIKDGKQDHGYYYSAEHWLII